jgi:hypothetical protein
MQLIREEERDDKISLMITLAKLINPNIPNSVVNQILNGNKKK